MSRLLLLIALCTFMLASCVKDKEIRPIEIFGDEALTDQDHTELLVNGTSIGNIKFVDAPLCGDINTLKTALMSVALSPYPLPMSLEICYK